MPRIQLKRGNHANLPNSGLLAGEPLLTLDRRNLWVALDATTREVPTPAVDQLATIPTIDLTSDLLLIHDADSTGQKEKKVTVQALKTALNIPEGTTDEKVAVASGATAGYIWGTDGTDGVIRMGPSMSWSRPGSGSYVVLDVAVVDGGTF
ncbi:MAG: hypothetical protein RMK51_03615 [Meiothermus sp.]|uniref:hypothetical protein n=1 Tax=Meiothermus sp. TaxID=1955249 RepID=UPI00298F3371|nr:hypothetical protein [Meiothermus sp.]MDW8424996.1 hypothetical protein [Meiothermus sp.]